MPIPFPPPHRLHCSVKVVRGVNIIYRCFIRLIRVPDSVELRVGGVEDASVVLGFGADEALGEGEDSSAFPVEVWSVGGADEEIAVALFGVFGWFIVAGGLGIGQG